MAISKEQWNEIEKQLSGSWGRVELTCDGYKVSAVIERVGPLKLAVSVYVDGLIRGEWIDGESEIPRKFHQEKKRFVFGAKYRAALLKSSKAKVWNKEEREKYAADAKRTISHWWPYWTNPKSFCSHIRKSCTNIEVVKIGH
jgi:hypothetical protein